jgi:hypothetical protein
MTIPPGGLDVAAGSLPQRRRELPDGMVSRVVRQAHSPVRLAKRDDDICRAADDPEIPASAFHQLPHTRRY